MIFDDLEYPKGEIKQGDLLLSDPFLEDPNFSRSVVLISEKNDAGFVGFILNKKVENIVVSDVLDVDFDFEADLYYGGPVDSDKLYFIHCYGKELEGSEEVVNGVFLGGDFDKLTELARLGIVKPNKVRFFLGYSGWDIEQLPEELNQNSWISTFSAKYDIFTLNPSTLWKYVLEDMGGKYKMISNFPEDPRLN